MSDLPLGITVTDWLVPRPPYLSQSAYIHSFEIAKYHGGHQATTLFSPMTHGSEDGGTAHHKAFADASILVFYHNIHFDNINKLYKTSEAVWGGYQG